MLFTYQHDWWHWTRWVLWPSAKGQGPQKIFLSKYINCLYLEASNADRSSDIQLKIFSPDDNRKCLSYHHLGSACDCQEPPSKPVSWTGSSGTCYVGKECSHLIKVSFSKLYQRESFSDKPDYAFPGLPLPNFCMRVSKPGNIFIKVFLHPFHLVVS